MDTVQFTRTLPVLCQLTALFLDFSALNVKLRKDKRRSRRRWWVRPINRTRVEDGFYHNLFATIKASDHEEFYRLTRMSPDMFDELLRKVEPFLVKKSIRAPLPTGMRLAITLQYLAHGDSAFSKHAEWRIGVSTAYKIIPETCVAIWKALQPEYLPTPTEGTWREAARGFEAKWNFPHCVGSVDGKHITIQAPPNSGSEYFNYKKFFSIVLMAICDPDYKFTWVDVGDHGSNSDGSVWANSGLGSMLANGEEIFPPPEELPGTQEELVPTTQTTHDTR